ncbi:MAG: glycoside hydrolase 5 family protein [Spirochaetia bacterium]
MKNNGFFLGVNYWASHAGTAMWSDWKPRRVEKDLDLLSEIGITTVRVFPLWSDFQPLDRLYGPANKPEEYRTGETALPEGGPEKSGLSLVHLGRFSELLDMLRRRGMKAIVGLITGWMSGRLFMPPAFRGRNALTDPEVIKWELRFVREFVSYFRNDESILGWDLGNECNCMDRVSGQDQAWLWTAAVSSAIRSADQERPVISGMHGLTVLSDGVWTLPDQGELTDYLTTHPYPIFTPHCKMDPLTTMRSFLHPAAQTSLYRDVGEKPCFVEEMGTLGPMVADEETSGTYIKNNLFSLFAHDCLGMMWWCNHDQNLLTHPPYDWVAMERQLGLFQHDDQPKKAAEEVKQFSRFLAEFPHPVLPRFNRHAVCILTQDQDQWGNGFGTFILAKQAGFDIEYQSIEQPLKESDVYLLPGISGTKVMSGRFWKELKRKIADGALLYISYDGGFVSEFDEVTGMRVKGRYQPDTPGSFDIDGCTMEIPSSFRLLLSEAGGKTVFSDSEGNPVCSRNKFGKGEVVFLGLPLEKHVITSPGTVYREDAVPFYRIYRRIFKTVIASRPVIKESKYLGVTEHYLDENTVIIFLINYSSEELFENIRINTDWDQPAVLRGEYSQTLRIPGAEAAILKLSRKGT